MHILPVRFFAFLEFIGTTELLVVLFVALLVFGPRKLPELGRSLGRALNQVRAASDDFKQTWEAEALGDGAGRDAGTLRDAEGDAAARPAPRATQEAEGGPAVAGLEVQTLGVQTAEAGG